MLQLKVAGATSACTYVNGSNEIAPEICLNLTEALGFVNRDNIQLLLDPGAHLLQNKSTPVFTNITRISFFGLGQTSADVRITCEDNVGLVFLRSNQLTIQSLSLISCSLGTNQLAMAQEFAERAFKQVIHIPNGLNAGVLISDCSDVTVSNVVISDTKGVGFVGLNLIGESQISNVHFNSNKPFVRRCPALNIFAEAKADLIGGGLYLLYQDYNSSFEAAAHVLTVSNCEFHGNEDCSDAWVPELYHGLPSRLQYSFGGGGGLTVINAQSQYTVQTSILNSSFELNSAKFGSGAHVGFFAGSENSVVDFYNCSFFRNGKAENPYSGGGISVLIDLVHPSDIRRNAKASNNSLVTVSKTHFIDNKAFFGGGLYVLALSSRSEQQRNLVVQDCHFRQNRAPIAAAMLVYTREANVFESMFSVEICNTLFEANDAFLSTGNENTEINGICSLFRGVQLTLTGSTGFYGNIGTAAVCSATHTYIDGNITFARTTAFAGTLRLNDLSTVTLRQNAVLRFSRNSVSPYGGAIYKSSQGSKIRYVQEGCFLYFQELNLLPQVESCPNFTGLNATIIFDGNSALIGTNLYGSTLENCNWAPCLRNSSGKTVLEALEDMRIVEVFARDNSSEALEVTTAPFKIQLLNYTEQHVMPGETFHVNLLVLDGYNQSIFSGLGAALTERSGRLALGSDGQVRLGPNGFWFVDRSVNFEGSLTPVSLSGTENQEFAVIVGSLEGGSNAFSMFNVTLTSCLLGFRYDTMSQSCVCETGFSQGIFSNEGASCDSSTGIITVPALGWLGPVVVDNQTLFGYTSCSLSYCPPMTVNITKENFNLRCHVNANRDGIGCGQCRANYSVTFGSSVCSQCSNYYLFLILVFMLAGLGTMFLCVFLRITIAEGYLNSVLFYSNLVNLFGFLLAPDADARGLLVPLSLLSTNLGFQVCFFDGMTTLHSYGLRFVYVIYLFVLMAFVTLISRFVQLPRSYIYSPTKVFATLLILCYTSLLETCVSIFAFTFVYTSDGRVLTRWFYDPNVVYFEGWHGFLFAFALVVMVIFVVPFPIFIVSPRLILRSKYLSKFKPLLDPFWAPLKPKYEWWVSFRLLFRMIPVILSAGFATVPLNFFILGLSIACLLFLQMKLQPFKGSLRNTLDDLLVTNLMLLVIGFLYFFDLRDIKGAVVYSSVFVALAYVIFIVIFIAQFNFQYPNLKKRLVKWIQRRLSKKETVTEQNGEVHESEEPPRNKPTHSEVVVSPRPQPSGSVRFAAPDASGVLKDSKFTHYRESLLADEDEERPAGLLDTLRSLEFETTI